MERNILIDLEEMAYEFIRENGVAIIINGEEIVYSDCTVKIDIPDFIYNYIAPKTPDGFIIKEGAYKDLEEDFFAFLWKEVMSRMQQENDTPDEEYIEKIKESEKRYEIEEDGG